MNYCNKNLIYFTLISLLVALGQGGTRKISDEEIVEQKNVINENKSEPNKSSVTGTPRSSLVNKKVQKINNNTPTVEEQLKSFSKDLVSSIMKKLEVQDGITKLTTDSLKPVSNSKGMTALESRRILDYISREISGHILKNTRSLVQPELQRLVYGLCQTAAEIAIMSSLRDISWTKTMAYAHHERSFSLRRKREIGRSNNSIISTEPNIKESVSATATDFSSNRNLKTSPEKLPMLESGLFDQDQKKPLLVLPAKETAADNSTGRFLHNIIVEKEINEDLLKVDHLVLENKVDSSAMTISRDKDEEVIRDLFYQESDLEQEHPEYTREEIFYGGSNKMRLNSEMLAEMALDVADFGENRSQSRKSKHHEKKYAERLENKAAKALKYASDVAYLTASTVVAARRAITSQMEVQMAVKFVKNGLSNHQGLMINLAKSAARKAGSEARSAFKKSVACDRALGVAMKYTAQSHGAKLNNLATRIIMDTVSAASISRSMSFMASKAAMEAMFEASEIIDA